jgi:hypothetical protein
VCNIFRAAWLKRARSATIRWNHGVTTWARFANSPFGELPLYSKSPISSLTPKVIADGCHATPRRSSNCWKFG